MQSGENINLLRQVENTLYEHPGVQDTTAILIPGQDHNKETLTAFVIINAIDLTEPDLYHHLQSRLPATLFAEQNLCVRIVTNIPKTLSGKVHRLKLLNDYRT